MNILEEIIAEKKKEVANRKSLFPIKLLAKSIYFISPTVSLKKYLLRTDKAGIIAEFKRKSPSKGFINKYANVERTSIGYMQAGASALSVLTDTNFFGGSSADLTIARKYNYCPILRKDFIIDEYQIIEAKSIGADAILLLANVLTAKEIKSLSKFSKSLGLEVLLEIRDKDELKSISADVDCVGVNNRDLKTFKTNVSRSFELSNLIPDDFVKISESGIDTAKTMADLKQAGYKGFLIGEAFMKNARPENACADLVKQINAI
jgi:indole-3-glycerol phosphate synthase